MVDENVVKLKRTGLILKSNPARVLLRPFNLSPERVIKIITRIMAMPERVVEEQLQQLVAEFGHRHREPERFWQERFEQVRPAGLAGQSISLARQQLIGAYFSHEYSLEAAALFNPSMVWHPDQAGLPAGQRRFIISLRATGEGHISSLTFRSGLIDEAGQITLDEPSRFVTAPDLITYDTQQQTSYQASFDPNCPLSERVLFPFTRDERNGIEDVRMVQFQDDKGDITYYATYTAYDGQVIQPKLLETADFLHFKINAFHGPAIQNKGFALFPRKINGLYAMLSRQDNENNYLMTSQDLYFWQEKKILLEPVFPWEFIQLGNCGSPIETDAGWLVLSHGVGPMRTYAIGAFLLDRDDPGRVIGRLREPLLVPNEQEREGYVPNVVYSCGGLVHGPNLIIPYALSDYASSFALVNLDELLAALAA
jgi:predicted GH43/DUF377 family glycosyl hydrolase